MPRNLDLNKSLFDSDVIDPQNTSSLGFHLTSECGDIVLSYHLPNGNPGRISQR